MLYKNRLIIIGLFLVLTSSCTTPIGLINKKPDKFDGKKVHVSGKVISSLRLKDIMCFTIKERNEKICIITKNYLPLTGGHIKLKGVVKKDFQYQGYNMLVIIEKQKKAKKFKSWKRKANPVIDE